MTIEQEMQLWETRSKDEFGKLIKKLDKATKEHFCPEKDEFGFETTPINKLMPSYALDGDRQEIYNKAYRICENYDLLQFSNISIILKQLAKLLNNNGSNR